MFSVVSQNVNITDLTGTFLRLGVETQCHVTSVIASSAIYFLSYIIMSKKYIDISALIQTILWNSAKLKF